MVEMTNMMQRMRELAVQSANDTNTQDDRGYMDAEFQQLKSEINRIAKNTEWNGMKIMDGSDSLGKVNGSDQTVSFQVGASVDANDSHNIKVDFKDFSFTPSTSSATASSTQANFAAVTAGDTIKNFSIDIGGVVASGSVTTSITADATAGEITNLGTELQGKINKFSGLEGVTVEAAGETLTFKDNQGRAIDATKIKFFESDGTTPVATVNSVIATGTAGGGAVGGGVFNASAPIHALSIVDRDKSEASITNLDLALKSVNNERSKMGSVINRLTYAADNLTNVSQNTSASRSRILDTDYAQATTELARTQIISQAATAMLAQANQAPQSVLSLLR
jgi:flagellin